MKGVITARLSGIVAHYPHLSPGRSSPRSKKTGPTSPSSRSFPPDLARARAAFPAGESPLIYDEPENLFTGILEEFLSTSLFRCYVESLRSENWYRLRTMEGASESLKRRVQELRSLYNYVRQEEITEEMLEILGGGMLFR
jgi:F-type H+-transporting ATPase subunit gamma